MGLHTRKWQSPLQTSSFNLEYELGCISANGQTAKRPNGQTVQTGALTPINQNAIKEGKCGNMERSQTERGKSEWDKAHISADPDFAQTDFAQTEFAKTIFCKSGIP
jgi:hypothetical protein